MPGSDLSQPANVTMPSSRSACMTASTESAMISRDTSEKCMPSWPIEMPSETEIVPNCIGKPPAACTPSLADRARRSSDRLQGVISFQLDATPIWGLGKSSSDMPTARSIPRAAARSRPSVTSELRGFMFVMAVQPIDPSFRAAPRLLRIRSGRPACPAPAGRP